ncbi:acyltransferase [Paraferrimonas sedimenticola]|uniref:Acyltransferase n=1 Tax=Paraferrimonas sedimenticola TaxID=375674 RepID=A0AA37VZB2_9GAMM|nr:acyltransferase [Paraferrimonas sedimenticola]GLP97571.1 acyltransferase [Paraferrimonas sedimenticola]
MTALLRPLIALFSFSLYTLNTLFWVVPILLFGLIKLIPIRLLRKGCTLIIDAAAASWVKVNGWIQDLSHPYKVQVSGDVNLSKSDWYMVIANHQTWVDILVLQRILGGKVPFLKFFLKKELLYVPVLGLAWWALDFPFMRRYTAAQLRKNPKLRGKDIETTKASCAQFQHQPVSIMNFVEGTRFTEDKYRKQAPQYQHLLRPRAGGLAFALAAMDERINHLLDVTIVYPNGRPTFWEFLSGQFSEAKVDIKLRSVDASLRGDYTSDRAFKQSFQQWLNGVWQEKDNTIARLKQPVSDTQAC